MVIGGYLSLSSREHGRKHTASDACHAYLILFLLFYLTEHLRLIPLTNDACQRVRVLTYHPVVCHAYKACLMLRGKRNGNDIAFVIAKALKHFEGVLAYINADSLAEMGSEFFAKQIIGTHITTVILIIGVRTSECEHDELIAGIAGIAPRCLISLLLHLCGTGG